MKYILAILLVLFASYADIFLFRIGIIPVQPSSFLIPLFIVIGFLKYSVLDFGDLVKSHSFKILASILFFAMVYAAVSPAPMDLIVKKISLDAIAVLLYMFAVQFFRTEDKWLVFLVMFGAFVTLAGSVWYDFFIGLPKYSVKLGEAVRKGGFGENPNQASSGIKFLALGVLVFLSKFKTKKILFIGVMVVSVFLTMSRSGIVSVILILIFGTANSWNVNFKITTPVLFKSVFKMIILFVSLYLGLVLFAGVIRENVPAFTRGAAGERLDLLLGKNTDNIIAEDSGSGGGRADLLFMYIDKFIENPLGYGTAYTSDQRLVPLNTHNYYLFLAVNYGFLALILYLIYFWVGLKLSFKRDQFYYLIFLALLFFEGFVSHYIYYTRALLISLAFFDSLIYKPHIHNVKKIEV
ncbi:O-antigen ligase family protein [Winogradskyella bathintestinalis]|uniref:O-antigen ligase family protein n=1 Tax=Winogradskyella bathintestinalis TaxID=3035208 RepID=A0ABT7ZXK6_9FLAO|nr:O-antigen ligase family protein [Winogradskyella bathintestinalis]MDN3493744.1 O-antigen ligase family protein [Winogradskyella bathintestinalis]